MAVVGGGIVGATAALLLANEGQTVALLEARRLGHGSTGLSTAKMTYWHHGWVADLIKQVGVESAHRIVHGERGALDVVERWTTQLRVEGAAKRCTSWVYGSTEEVRAGLEAEREACAQLEIETRWAAPGEVPYGAFALGLDDQLLIEPSVVVAAFADHAASLGAHVHEHSRVVDVQLGDVCELTTENGSVVRAPHVVIATQVPILDRSMVFAASKYRRSHVVALEHPGALEQAPDMYTGLGPGGLSVRASRDIDGTPVLIVAGNGHDLDTDEDGSHVDQLELDARALTGAGARRRAWLAHDIFPDDGHPFVGPIHGSDNVYIATGYGGWGLSGGVAGAMAIAGLILRGHSLWQPDQAARRVGPYVSKDAIVEGARTAKKQVMDRVSTAGTDDVPALERGEGLVTRVGTKTVAVARDSDGALQAVEAACTHLGCIVRHDAERNCWQCPCHGSRFSLDGEVLQGPATRPLAQVDPAELDRT